MNVIRECKNGMSSLGMINSLLRMNADANHTQVNNQINVVVNDLSKYSTINVNKYIKDLLYGTNLDFRLYLQWVYD